MSVVVIDDSQAVREYLVRMLSKVSGCSIVGLAADGEIGLELVRKLKPGLVVLDISMPNRDGLQVLRDIRREDRETVVVMFTSEPAYKDLCLEAGANFYLDKRELDELRRICEDMLSAN